jgi:AcrR family transcriptional regulator
MPQRIVVAAADVLRQRGFADTTTKEIARVAGISEGSIYNHFENKTALIAAAMGEVTSGIRAAMMRLLEQVGQNTVEENLAEFAEAQVHFLLELLPITGPTLGSPELREWLRRGGPAPDAATPPGPVLGHAGLIAYLEAEQRGRRLAADAQLPYLAAALLGGCQQYAYLTLVTRAEVMSTVARLPSDPAAFAREVARTVLTGQLRPRRAPANR